LLRILHFNGASAFFYCSLSSYCKGFVFKQLSFVEGVSKRFYSFGF